MGGVETPMRESVLSERAYLDMVARPKIKGKEVYRRIFAIRRKQ